VSIRLVVRACTGALQSRIGGALSTLSGRSRTAASEQAHLPVNTKSRTPSVLPLSSLSFSNGSTATDLPGDDAVDAGSLSGTNRSASSSTTATLSTTMIAKSSLR
jgi:hypothetical protein